MLYSLTAVSSVETATRPIRALQVGIRMRQSQKIVTEMATKTVISVDECDAVASRCKSKIGKLAVQSDDQARMYDYVVVMMEMMLLECTSHRNHCDKR